MCFFFSKSMTRYIGSWALAMFLFMVCPVNVLAEMVFQNEELNRAWELYQDAEPTEALGVIERALQSGSLSAEDRVNAFVLQGRCLVMDNRNDEALDSFRNVLALQPDYEPEAADWTTPQLEVFHQVQAEAAGVTETETVAEDTGGKTPWFKKPITWVAAGVVAVVAFVVLSGGEDEDLDEFPDPPEDGK